MNRTLKIAQLEVHICLTEKQIANLDFLAVNHADAAAREEARNEAEQKRNEVSDMHRQIEEAETE